MREEGAIGWDGDSAAESVDDGGGESGGVNDVAGSSCSGFGLGGRDLGRRTAMITAATIKAKATLAMFILDYRVALMSWAPASVWSV